MFYTSRSFFWLDNPTDFIIHPFRQVISSLLIDCCAIEQAFGVFVFQKMRYDIVIELPLLQYPKKLNK